jgi:two-component system, NtrC family, nitrogen regulation sensor histidine kinase NtrY
MTYALVFCFSIAGILLYLLISASANTALFARNYPLLLGLNAVLALALVGLVSYQLRVLWAKLKARVFGAKLTLRLVIMFASFAVLPGVLVYTVSVQFVSKSIESWFDVRVDNALEGGLKLGQAALDYLLEDLDRRAHTMAQEVADAPPEAVVRVLTRLREQSGVTEITLISGSGRVVATASRDVGVLMPNLPTTTVLREVRLKKSYAAIETAPDEGVLLRVIVPVSASALSIADEQRYLQLYTAAPQQLADNALAVQNGRRDYQELSLSRQGLKRIYTLTLTLTLLLALFSAIALAFVMSNRLSAPLTILAEGTRAVAQGDFSPRQAIAGSDELGVLTQSFNTMTRQLDEARAVVEQKQHQLEAAKAYLESVLSNLSAGVLVFDRELVLSTANQGAALILKQPLEQYLGRHLSEVAALAPLAPTIAAEFEREGVWQKQLEFEIGDRQQVLLARGSRLPAASGQGLVVVFDDITELMQAQRDIAWGEVARRLAHEIKNPLTPIQLSAERIEHRLADRLGPEDAEVLRRATSTIVSQVAAMKQMVDDFRDYSRALPAVLVEIDLNALIRSVLDLYAASSARIETRLAPQLPPIRGDETQLRQLIHNLLQNAQDALGGVNSPLIEIATETAGAEVRLTVRDNGSGFAKKIMTRVFEPYATTKPKGTGLGLAIVKKIVDVHQGTIKIENIKPHGACVSIVIPLAQAA